MRTQGGRVPKLFSPPQRRGRRYQEKHSVPVTGMVMMWWQKQHYIWCLAKKSSLSHISDSAHHDKIIKRHFHIFCILEGVQRGLNPVFLLASTLALLYKVSNRAVIVYLRCKICMSSSDFSLFLQNVEKMCNLFSSQSSKGGTLVNLFAFSTRFQKTIVPKEKRLGTIPEGKYLFCVNVKS